MRRILIFDTSILCVWLDVPDMNDCGPDDDKWDKQRIEAKVELESNNNAVFVLPLASIIETGNHIAQARHSRKERGDALGSLMQMSALQQTPWAAFSDQAVLWSSEKLTTLATEWPNLALQRMSLGDATIKDVAEYYAQMGCHVEILTGDRGLRAYQPAEPLQIPRRRQR